MKALRLLPLIAAVGLAACGEKKPAEAPPAQSSAPAPTPAPAPAPTPAPAPAPAPEASPTPTPAPTSSSEPAPAPGASPAPTPAPSPAPAPAPSSGASPSGAQASGGDLAKGEKVYNANCVSCHGTGVMTAPKLGDKAAWEPRIAKGKEALYTSSINGIRLMPPKGGNAALKDEDLKAAVDFMLSKAS